MWAPTLYQLAEVLGVEVEELRVVYETDGLDHDVETGFGTVAAGTASVVHFELQALPGGRPFAVVEHVDCVARDVGKQWKQPFGPADMSYRIEIEGDPSFTVEMNFGEGGQILSAMPAINCVPAVCRQARTAGSAGCATVLGTQYRGAYLTRRAFAISMCTSGRRTNAHLVTVGAADTFAAMR
jgi:hypothetical protein